MVTFGMRRSTCWLNPLLPGLTPNVLSRPKDGDVLAVLSVVLRSVVIFTVAAEQVAFQDLWDLQCLHCFFCREAHRILWVGLRQATLQFFLHLVVSLFSPGR